MGSACICQYQNKEKYAYCRQKTICTFKLAAMLYNYRFIMLLTREFNSFLDKERKHNA